MAEASIITNQYVRIDQTPAGVGDRIFARLIDCVIMFCYACGALYFVTESSLFKQSDDTALTVFVLLALPVVFYSLMWEILYQGRTPGKMLFHLRVVMRDGSIPSLSAYLMRWVFLLLDFWMSQVGLFVMLLNRHNQRCGDLAAGTIVIKEHRAQSISALFKTDLLHLKSFDYKYPQAENLSVEQVKTINEALAKKDDKHLERISLLADKVREFLNIQPPFFLKPPEINKREFAHLMALNDTLFLQQVLHNYKYHDILEELSDGNRSQQSGLL